MFNQLLPKRIDNTYRGYTPALWIFGLLMFIWVAMSLNSILNGHTVASTADGIPLDTFTPAGAQTVVSLFALLGLSRLMIALLGLVALARYRAMVPLMFALLLLDHVSRRLILQVLPIPRAGTPPASIINLVLLALLVVGLALSVRRQESLPAKE
jgi:hypothetical protein